MDFVLSIVGAESKYPQITAIIKPNAFLPPYFKLCLLTYFPIEDQSPTKVVVNATRIHLLRVDYKVYFNPQIFSFFSFIITRQFQKFFWTFLIKGFA